MRVGIDARFYGTLGKGLGRYTQKLLTYLEKIDADNEYFVFLRKENWADYQPINKNFKKVMADYQWYTVGEQFFMPLKLWTMKLDLMHFTHFNVPLAYFGPFIVTIHDLILTKYPTERATRLGALKYRIKNTGYNTVISAAIRKAQKVITVSQYTKQEIVEHFSVDPAKVAVTYEGVDPFYQTIPESDSHVVARHGVRKPYLLYVGNVYPHKNIEGLLSAFSEIVVEKPEFQLVLVGKEDYFFKRLKHEVSLRNLKEKVVFTGFVTDTDLPSLYRQAAAYVFPSFCEGFGLPALEACQAGIPVVASNSSSLPEVLEDAAVYFDPHDPHDIAETVLSLLDDKIKIKKLRDLGFRQVLKFSWERMAQETNKIYRTARR